MKSTIVKTLYLLLDQQKQTLDKHDIGYDETSEVILLKLNTLGKRFVSSSTINIEGMQ